MCFLISLPTGLMPVQYLLPLLRVVFVRETAVIIFFVLFCQCNSSYLRVVLSVKQVSVPLRHVCSSRSLFLSFPFRSSCITFFRTAVVDFALFFFHLLFFSFIFFSSFFLFFFSFFLFFIVQVWSGLFCCVLVPDTLALHLLHLDELRPPVWLLCFTVCDHIICILLA